MTVEMIPVSAVIPTKNRSASLLRTFESLVQQAIQPREILVVDAGDDASTHQVCTRVFDGLTANIRWQKASTVGAARQRNQGMQQVTQPFVWFFDDDILLDPHCVERLWKAISSDQQLGGVSAMIKNQNYGMPGAVSRFMFQWMNGKHEPTYSGRVIGPAVNLLPEDRDDLPDVVPVEWLNTTCTMYRREALPLPPFDSHFKGYSLMEDVALSLKVAQAGWKLANVRTARIYHDSQSGEHKNSSTARAEMEFANRYYVMTEVLQRQGVRDYLKLFAFEGFNLLSLMWSRDGFRSFWATLKGKARAVWKLVSKNRLRYS